MSLQTPDSIRRLQRKLYLKAKAEPDFRFYLLYEPLAEFADRGIFCSGDRSVITLGAGQA